LPAKPDSSINAEYVERLGPVTGFKQYDNKGSGKIIYAFRFNQAGHIVEIDIPPYGFSFDENGRLTHWHSGKWNYWGHPSK
jgi:hypothetical protein